jgi:DNA-binding NarL/FixJ family response regulator
MKILVVDDHALIREALRGVLKELKEDTIILEASDWQQATSLMQEHSDLGLILLDLSLPDKNGFTALAELRDYYSAIPTIVLSAFNERANVIKALDLGALGFIPKSAQRAVMLSALNLIFSGGIYIPPDALEGRGSVQVAPEAIIERRVTNEPNLSAADLGLTERQVAVLALMMRGKSNKAIGRALDLAEPTVKNHVTAILKALKVANRTEAVVKVAELGWDLMEVGK